MKRAGTGGHPAPADGFVEGAHGGEKLFRKVMAAITDSEDKSAPPVIRAFILGAYYWLPPP